MKKNFIIVSVAILLAVVGVKAAELSVDELREIFGVQQMNSPQTALGSVTFGNEYSATNTFEMGVGQHLIKTGLGTLGSVIVTSTLYGNVTFYDATSTTDVASTTIHAFKSGTTPNTYVFDTQLTRGLSLDVPTGLTGTSVSITYR